MGFYDDVFKKELEPFEDSDRFREQAPLEEPQPQTKPAPRAKPKPRKVEKAAGPPTALKSCAVRLEAGGEVKLRMGQQVFDLPESDRKRLTRHGFIK